MRSPFVPWAWSGQRRVGQRAQLALSTVMKRPRGNTIPAVCCYTVLLLEIITHHWEVCVCVCVCVCWGCGVLLPKDCCRELSEVGSGGSTPPKPCVIDIV